MAFPTTSVLDNFNRADGALGSNWSTPTFAAGFNISSNVAFGSTTGNIQYWNVATYGPDFEIYADIPNLPGSGQQCGLTGGVLQQTSAITLDGYAVAYTHGSPGTLAIQRITNGVVAATVASSSQTLSAGDQIGLSRVGTTLTSYINGTQIDTGTDSTHTGAGYLLMFSTNTTNSFDDFGGGTLSGAAATSRPLFRARMPAAILAR